MSAPTVEDIATDLSVAAELDGDWGYQLSADGTHIVAEYYAADGTVSESYEIRVTIERATS